MIKTLCVKQIYLPSLTRSGVFLHISVMKQKSTKKRNAQNPENDMSPNAMYFLEFNIKFPAIKYKVSWNQTKFSHRYLNLTQLF